MVDAINVRDFAPAGTTVGTGNQVADESAILDAAADGLPNGTLYRIGRFPRIR